MSLQVVLFIGPVSEKSSALVEAVGQETLVGCCQLETLAEAKQAIDLILPDLLFVYADVLEENGEDVIGFCRSLRESFLGKGFEQRPVIVIETGTQDEKKRIEYLMHGADDTIIASLGVDELQVRLLVHLRRNLDLLSSRVTQLPSLPLIHKILQRKINEKQNNPDSDWAFMAVELDHFEIYQEVYGELAGNQVLRTFASLVGTLVLMPDCVGFSEETNIFYVVTHPDRVEKLASLLCRQFDTVVPNFYSERDRKRGYLISVEEGQISRRVPLFSLSAGIVTSEVQQYQTYQAAFNSVSEMKNLARRTIGSHWVSDRLRLAGSKAEPVAVVEKPLVLVVESDAALAYLLKTTLEMQHYSVEAVSNVEEAREYLSQHPVRLVLMDSVINEETVGWELCQEFKTGHSDLNVVFLSTIHDREKALGAGADLYLPKPFELVSLFNWLGQLVY